MEMTIEEIQLVFGVTGLGKGDGTEETNSDIAL